MDFKDFTTRDERLIAPIDCEKHTVKSDLWMCLGAAGLGLFLGVAYWIITLAK